MAVKYAWRLMEAGLGGFKTSVQRSEKRPLSPGFARSCVASAVAGAAVGLLSAYRGPRRASRSHIAMASLVGSALGFGGGAAWAARGVTAAAARRAMQQINAVRDAHWLEQHPITYA